MNENGRILAIDAGTKRVGIALSDELRITGQPYSTLEPKSHEDLVNLIKGIVEKEKVTEIVIGLPKRLDGSIGEMGESVKVLANSLKKAMPVSVRLWDERFSTHAAQRALLEGDVRRKKRKAVIDKTAAAWILQGYLDSLQLR